MIYLNVGQISHNMLWYRNLPLSISVTIAFTHCWITVGDKRKMLNTAWGILTDFSYLGVVSKSIRLIIRVIMNRETLVYKGSSNSLKKIYLDVVMNWFKKKSDKVLTDTYM